MSIQISRYGDKYNVAVLLVAASCHPDRPAQVRGSGKSTTRRARLDHATDLLWRIPAGSRRKATGRIPDREIIVPATQLILAPFPEAHAP